MNLAFEEAVFRCVGAGLVDNTLRIWRNKNAVVIGYFQDAREEVNLETAMKLGVSVVRRFTGGGAVYHDLGNVNYALSVKMSENIAKDYLNIYGKYLRGALLALEKLGAKPYIENINDIIVSNRKVSGTAASIGKGAEFIHGSILVNTDLTILSRVIKVSPTKLADKKVSDVKYRVVTLESLLARKISYREVLDALVEGFSELLSAEPYFDLPSEEELEVAKILWEDRYKTIEWNFERKPLTAYKELEEKIAQITSLK
ncbi:MAG: lipoate--protein ligase family protein [Thermofilum sp.]|jgi:lipoate-protein ligase A|nr:lipoate--protein ligase family protein [Thermofilum sp.]